MSVKPPADGRKAERKPLRLLMVEDDPNDEALVLRHLRHNGYDVAHLRVDTAPAMKEALTQHWDLVLSDFSMPAFSATAALAVLKEQEIDIPFIIVSGTIDEENAVDSMRAGAQDFLPKGKLARLVPAIERELREATIRGERRKMQERLFVADRMASVGTLAAGVAHEINNPLAALVANLDLVALSLAALSKPNVVGPNAPARPPVPESVESRLREIEEPLSDAREAADRVRQIVKDVRVFSRFEGAERRAVDVRRILDSSVRIAWNEIRNRARLKKSYGEVPAVLGNESRLGQVFLNLIVNAAQAIAEGNPADNEIEIVTARADDGGVVVEVRDTGSGIPAALRGKIFDAFFTTKPEGVGTGLGLSICHRLVTEMGGSISVDSEEGKGSRFRITLQPAGAEAPAHTPLPLIPTGAARRGRILVIDDEPTLGAVVNRMLGAQHEVSTLTSAREAAERIGRGERYDVIFTDLFMPGMTGMELHADLVRKVPEQAERMVFMSGGTFSPRSRDFLTQVPNPRISKPFDAGTLMALVHNLIR